MARQGTLILEIDAIKPALLEMDFVRLGWSFVVGPMVEAADLVTGFDMEMPVVIISIVLGANNGVRIAK